VAGFTPTVLGTDRQLRAVTARAMREAARAVRGEARGVLAFLFRRAPVAALSLLLCALPRLLSRDLATMWRHHGPKIVPQTVEMLGQLLDRAEQRGVAAPNLATLRLRVMS
jgi:hypothetical protein